MALTKISRGLLDTGVSDSSDSTAITIDSSERVQIGSTGITSTIDSSFHAHQSVDGDAIYYLFNDTQSSSSSTNETTQLYLGWRDAATGVAVAPRIVAGKEGDFTTAGNADSFLAFHTSADNTLSEKVRINSSGLVGIGRTPNANGILQLNVASGSNCNITFSENTTEKFLIGSVTSSNNFRIYDLANSAERININGTTGTTELKNNTSGEFVNLMQHSSSSEPHGFQISFTAAAPNATNRYFCRMGDTSEFKFIIDSQGNVQSRTNSFGGISDEKLKENIVDATPKLDELMQLEIKNFNFIGDDKKQLGVIAQQVETIFPNLIDERPDQDPITNEDLGTTSKSVKYSVFVPMLIKGMQEQQTIIDDLKTRIETLENA